MSDEIIEDILTFYFSVDDYEEFAKKHALESLINLTDPDINNNTPVLEFLSEELTLYKDDIIEQDISEPKLRFPEPDEISEPEPERFTKEIDDLGDRDPVERIDTKQLQNNSFILKGDNWFVRYKGEETILRNLDRTRYIIHLLDNPEIKMASHDLVALVKGNIPEQNEDYTKMSKEELENEGLSFVEHDIEGLSKEEKGRLESMAYDHWNKLMDAQTKGESSQIIKEKKAWRKLIRYFLNEYAIEVRGSKKGLGFHMKKRLKNDSEKARVNTSKQIKNAIDDIKNKLPELGIHLEKNITKGAKCCYDPDKTVIWNIQK